jgi:CDGSH-type Zn-finger protein
VSIVCSRIVKRREQGFLCRCGRTA